MTSNGNPLLDNEFTIREGSVVRDDRLSLRNNWFRFEILRKV